jgi:hypothetical protein
MAFQDIDTHTKALSVACNELHIAVDEGSMGAVVEKSHNLIMQYYKDVLRHVEKSFEVALWSAIFGFVIFFITLVYALVVNWVHPGQQNTLLHDSGAFIGLLSGSVVQVFAGVTFYLYKKASDQFSAFHICLERTHRYLLAYKMVKELKAHEDDTLRDLICIMAKAPMISRTESADGDSKHRNSS